MKKKNMRKKWTAAVLAFCMMATTAAPISAAEAKTPESAADGVEAAMATVDTVNDTRESPAEISLGINYESELKEANNTVDFYKFTIPSSGTVKLTISSSVDDDIRYDIYSLSSGALIKNYAGWIDNVSKLYYGNHDIPLTKGSYRIEVKAGIVSDEGKYNFTVSHTPSGESFPESGEGSNNSMNTASPISLGTTYKGQLAITDTADFYKFHATAGTYILSTSSAESVNWYLYDSYGQRITFGFSPQSGIKRVLTEGDYYIAFSDDNDMGDYTFSITEYIPVLTATTSYTKTYKSGSYYQETFNLDAKSSGGEGILYTSSNSKVVTVEGTYSGGKVTVKGPGKAVITATVEGFPTIQKKITVTVKPAKVASLKAKRTAKTKMTVSWKRDKTVTGYEITYALNKKFTKGKKTVKIGKNKTVKKTIKKLKANKAYYVKVRAYKTSGGTKIYGKYSKTIKVKVKK